MTITKQDLDNWIEREADRIIEKEYGSKDYGPKGEVIAGANLLAPLLLQVCEALAHRWPGETGFHVSEFYRHTLSQIEAAVKGGGKMNDYKFKMKDFTLHALPTEETQKRLSETAAGFMKQIMLNEERAIIQSLPNEALLQLKKSVDETCEVRGLK